MIKMYPEKSPRGRKAARSAAIAFAITSICQTRFCAADDSFTLSGGGIWSTASSWTSTNNANLHLAPVTGDIADIFIPYNVNFNLTATNGNVKFGGVQIAGNNGTGQLTLNTTFGTPYFESTGGLYVGGSYTGVVGIPGNGPGKVTQSAGAVQLDGSALEVDPTSSYVLSSVSSISAGYEQLGGVFTQSGTSTNGLAGGSPMLNFGSYTLTGGAVSADTITNTVIYNASNGVTYNGAFNQSAGTVQGTSTTGSFINNASFVFSGGTFADTMTNNAGATINVNSATIPFTAGVVNNGRLTVTAPNSSSGTFAGAITGTTGTLLFNGSSTSVVTLTGTSSYSGQTTVAAGTVILAGPTGTPLVGSINGGITVSSGATLQTNSDYQFSPSSLLTINGGIVNLNGHNESIGTLTMNGGQINQSSGSGIGLQVTTGQINIGKASATINGGLQSNNPLNFNIASSGSLTLAGNVSGYSNAPAGVVVTGGGQLSISAGSIISSIDVQQGIVSVSEGGNFGNTSNSVTVESAGSFSIGSQTVTTGAISGSGTIFLGTGLLNVNIANGSSGTFGGTINGTGSLNKLGLGLLTLTGTDSSSGTNNVSGGTLTVAPSGSIAGSSINVQSQTTANFYGTLINLPNIVAQGTVNFEPNAGSGILVRNVSAITVGSNSIPGNGTVKIVQASPHTNRTLLYASSLTLTGSTGAWNSTVDVANNDMSVHNGSIANISDQVHSAFANGTWTGSGVTSSAAAADTTHLTSLGVILNDDGQGNLLYSASSALGLFDGTTPGVTDVLIKYTYFGDANLDGKVDASDYSRIDSTYLNEGFVNGVTNNPISGWYNGDFNYDGVVNGSDYTLIDNAFNNQGSNLSTSAQLADVTAELTATSVPEPTSTAAVLALTAATLRRRRK